MPLNCPHHVQWIRRVPGGLHQCIQCYRVVARAEVTPKVDDLPDVRRRWDEHEARGAEAAAEPGEAPAKASGEGGR